MNELGDKVGGADKQKIEDAIAALKQALQGDDVEAIKSKTEALKQASYKIAEEIYKQQGGAAGAGAAGGAGAGPNMGGAGGASGASGASGAGPDKGKADDVDYEFVDDEK